MYNLETTVQLGMEINTELCGCEENESRLSVDWYFWYKHLLFIFISE